MKQIYRDLISEWDNAFGRRCLTLHQAVLAADKHPSLSNVFAELCADKFLRSNKAVSARRLGQLISESLDDFSGELVMTVSHTGGSGSYYQVVTQDQYNTWYANGLVTLTDEELAETIANTRGSIRTEALAERMSREGKVVPLSTCDEAVDSGDLVILDIQTGLHQKFNAFTHKESAIAGVAVKYADVVTNDVENDDSSANTEQNQDDSLTDNRSHDMFPLNNTFTKWRTVSLVALSVLSLIGGIVATFVNH